MSRVEAPEPSLPRSTRLYLIVIHVLVLPLALLGGLFAVALFLEVSFGSLVFVLTGVFTVVLLSASGWGQRSAATSRVGVLIQRADQVYVDDVSEGRQFEIPVITRVAVVLFAATVIGWAVLVASYLGVLPYL